MDFRHPNLVHENKCPLEGIVHLLKHSISDTFPPQLLPPKLQVVVPQLVTAQDKEGNA